MLFSVNDKFEHEFTVTEKVYATFIATFNDCNPLHIDDAFAQAKGFNSKVMHGNILGGFLSYFIGECLPTKDVIIHSQQLSFTNAVYLNNTLRFVATVIEVYESVSTVVFKFSFTNQEGKVACKGKIQIGII